MLYVKSKDEYEFDEVTNLYSKFRKELPYFVTPQFNTETKLELLDLKITKEGNKHLLFNPNTATWCFINEDEWNVCRELSSEIKFSKLNKEKANKFSKEKLKKFLTHLYRRGMLKIDRKAGIEQDIYSEGPLFNRHYLIELLITEKCNLNCRYCFAEASNNKKNMPLDIGFKAVDKTLDLPADDIQIEFAGGEVFTRFDSFTKLVEYIEEGAKRTGKKVYMPVQSNCTTLNDKIIEFARDHNIGIGISLDGPKDINDKTRYFNNGRGSYQQAILGFDKIIKIAHKIIGTLTVVNKYNYDKAKTILDHFASLGIHKMRFNAALRLGRANSRWNNVAISPEQYFYFMKEVFEYIAEKPLYLEPNLMAMLRNLVMRTRDFRCMRSPCGAGYDYIAIDPQGDLYPCAHHTDWKELCFGNIKEVESLEFSFMNNPIIREMSNRIVDSISECRDCTWIHLCEGGCSLNTYVQYGTLYHSSPLCEYYKEMYPYLLHYIGKKPDIVTHFVPEAMVVED